MISVRPNSKGPLDDRCPALDDGAGFAAAFNAARASEALARFSAAAALDCPLDDAAGFAAGFEAGYESGDDAERADAASILSRRDAAYGNALECDGFAAGFAAGVAAAADAASILARRDAAYGNPLECDGFSAGFESE